jgi:pimeloyl-ACP methyl ester carboxylesterase
LKVGLERVECEGSVYFRGGKAGAPVMVLVHGVNDQAGTWAPVAAALAARFRLVIPDLAGHGESGPAEGPLPLPMIVRKFSTIIDQETHDPVTLVGNSMGGWVSILYTVAHPDRVSRLVLEDGSGMAWLLKVPLLPATREQAIVVLHAVNGPNAETPDWAIQTMLERSKSAPMTRLTEAMTNLVDPLLPKITTPTTLIWGADDGLLPIAYAEALAKKINGSSLHVISGAAHIPHRQQPEKFLACLNSSC